MKVTISCHQGRYNFANPSEVQFNLILSTPFGSVSETFCDDPETFEMMPTDVLDAIERRSKSYLFSTGREALLAKIASIRENAGDVDRMYLEQAVESAEEKLKSAQLRLNRFLAGL